LPRHVVVEPVSVEYYQGPNVDQGRLRLSGCSS
jgi:hypothetical protein